MSTSQPKPLRRDTSNAAAQRHVLIVGKSPAVLASAVSLLHDRGYMADATNRFDDVIAEFNLRRVDLVVFGGQVPEERQAALRRDIVRLNERVIFVQGLAGIPGLIVRQVEGAFAVRDEHCESPPSYHAEVRTINLSLRQSRDVTVIGWWQTSFVPPNPLSDSLIIIDKRFPDGEHSIPLPHVVPQTASFVSVQVDDAIWAFSVATHSRPT